MSRPLKRSRMPLCSCVYISYMQSIRSRIINIKKLGFLPTLNSNIRTLPSTLIDISITWQEVWNKTCCFSVTFLSKPGNNFTFMQSWLDFLHTFCILKKCLWDRLPGYTNIFRSDPHIKMLSAPTNYIQDQYSPIYTEIL